MRRFYLQHLVPAFTEMARTPIKTGSILTLVMTTYLTAVGMGYINIHYIAPHITSPYLIPFMTYTNMHQVVLFAFLLAVLQLLFPLWVQERFGTPRPTSPRKKSWGQLNMSQND